MTKSLITGVVAVVFLGVGILVGMYLNMHGHTDGLIGGLFEEYNRAVVKDVSQLDETAVINHKLHLDFLEEKVEAIFSTNVTYSPELKENWGRLKSVRKLNSSDNDMQSDTHASLR